MKKFSSILLSALLTCLVFSAVLYSSCTKGSGASCEMLICNNGGTCRSGKCVCPTGYEGVLCEKPVDPCKLITCQHNGTCVNGSCVCQEGFSGQFCEIDACATLNCGHGACRNGKCKCDPGYEGQHCDALIRAKFLGTWQGTSTTCNNPDQVTITITENNVSLLHAWVNYKSDNDSFKVWVKAEGNKLSVENPQPGYTNFSMTVNDNTATYFFVTKRECHGQLTK